MTCRRESRQRELSRSIKHRIRLNILTAARIAAVGLTVIIRFALPAGNASTNKWQRDATNT
jgi:hypothetical protein